MSVPPPSLSSAAFAFLPPSLLPALSTRPTLTELHAPQVVIKPEYGFGAEGKPDWVGPKDSIEYHLTLDSMQAAPSIYQLSNMEKKVGPSRVHDTAPVGVEGLGIRGWHWASELERCRVDGGSFAVLV